MALVLIVFEGGAWDGRSAKIDAGAHERNGRAERWAKDEGETHVFQKTDRAKQVEVEHDTRQGKRYTTAEAVVYELVEKKPDLSSWTAPKKKPTKAAKPAKVAKPKKARTQETLF